MEFLGKNTRVGCYSLLQGIFPTQGSNLHLSHLLHWQENSLPLCYLGSPLLKYAFIYLYIAFSVCQNHDKLGSSNLDYKHLLRNSQHKNFTSMAFNCSYQDFETLKPSIDFSSSAMKVLNDIFLHKAVLSTLKIWCFVEPPSLMI